MQGQQGLESITLWRDPGVGRGGGTPSPGMSFPSLSWIWSPLAKRGGVLCEVAGPRDAAEFDVGVGGHELVDRWLDGPDVKVDQVIGQSLGGLGLGLGSKAGTAGSA